MLFNIFEFIYNNIFVVSIITVSFFLAIVFGRKWYEEVKMNKRLNIKKNMLRSLRNVSFRLPSLTRTLRVFVPIIFLGLFFLVSFDVPKENTHHVKSVENKQVFRSIYEEFNENFYSTPLQDTSILEEARDENTSLEEISKERIDGLDYVASDDDFVYVANNSNIKIISETEESFKIEKVIPFPQIEESCDEQAFDLEGIALSSNKLLVVGTFSQAQCEDSTKSLFSGSETIVRTYLKDGGFEMTDEYIISGHMNQGYYEDGKLILVSNAFLPADPDLENPEKYLPYVDYNDDREMANFRDLRYIENTNPNTFVSLLLIDVDSGEYDFETTLSDYKYRLAMNRDSVYLVTSAYEFGTPSEVFEMQNPIEKTHTIISKFSLKDNVIYYSKTSMHENMVMPLNGLIQEGDAVFALFKTEETYRLYWFDSNIALKDYIQVDISEPYHRMEFINDSIFVYEKNIELPTNEVLLSNNQMEVMDRDDDEKLDITSIYALSNPNTYLTLTTNDTSLSFKLIAENGNEVDTFDLNLSKFNIHPPLRYFDNKALNIDVQGHRVYFPLAALSEDPNYLFKETVLVLSLREEREIMEKPVIELKNIANPAIPFVYRLVSIADHHYHVTPTGIFMTINENEEVIKKLRID